MLVSGTTKGKQTLSQIPDKEKGGSLADIAPWAVLFCPDAQSPFLCPVSGHCVPKTQGGMVDLLCTLGKLPISLASIFL